jgi:hypothetical protein
LQRLKGNVNLSMSTKKPQQKIKRIRRHRNDIERGVDTLKYCGVLKLKEDPLVIQKKLRDEWR